MKVECIGFPLVVVLIICKAAMAELDGPPQSHEQPHEQQLQNNDAQEKRGAGTRDLVRFFLMAFHNNYPNSAHYGRGSMGIPFRPVRRIGSEFLGKRSVGRPSSEEMNQLDELSSDKRAMGSEFLGKRRLGSEFLGKRSDGNDYSSNMAENFREWAHQLQLLQQQPQSVYPTQDIMMNGVEKRALGSEFLGKRWHTNPYDFSWKRGRIGSEFLGKRVMGSEFLGKRSSGIGGDLGTSEFTATADGQPGPGPREMSQAQAIAMGIPT